MRNDAHLAWALALPALAVIAAVALVPVGWTVWESLHLHDLRMPWRGQPFVGVANYIEALTSPRFQGAMLRTLVFAFLTVALELTLGLVLALALDRLVRGRDAVRTAILLPWAIPTVAAALVWRFMFESPAGLADALFARAGLPPVTWLADPTAAWVPLVLADVWKSTPFVAVLLLAGLQSIDRSLYEAARVDGASWRRQLVEITLPLLRPALLVAFLFRTLDAFRVFDIVYVVTGGGPGTATEPLAMLTFSALLQNLRFGYGASLAVIMFCLSFVFALVCIVVLGRGTLMERTR